MSDARVRRLYALVAGLLGLGFVFGRPDAQGRNRIPLPIRMACSALVLLAAVLLARARPGRASRLTAVGMTCGFVGDLAMAEVLPLPNNLIGGMLAFGAGHASYIAAFGARGSAPARVHRQALALAGVGGLAGWWTVGRSPDMPALLNRGSLAYTLLLSAMAGEAGALALAERRHAPVAAGAGLFLASDLLLAYELFRRGHFRSIGDAVWLLYITGQALIVAGAPDSEA